MANLKLIPDRSLITADFDGYKLSNGADVITTYNKPIADGLKNVSSSSSDGTSYLYTRMISLHNFLVTDIKENCAQELFQIYCFNSRGQLNVFDYCEDSRLSEGRVVWQMSLTSNASVPTLLLPNQLKSEQREISGVMFGVLPASLVFADAATAIVSDGTGHMYVIHTGDRSKHQTWQTVFTSVVGSHSVMDARILTPSTAKGTAASSLHVLLVTAVSPSCLPVEPPPHLKSHPSLHLITWLTFSTDDGHSYNPGREQLYVCTTPLQYCQFNTDCSTIVLLTHQHCHLIHDSLRPNMAAEINKKKQEEGSAEQNKPLYVYYQTDDEVCVRLSAGSELSSDDLRIVVSSKQLTISHMDGSEIIKGSFIKPVDPQTATWVIEGGTVEVTVSKEEAGVRWDALMLEQEELRGQEVMGEEQMNEMQSLLTHLTTDSWNSGDSGVKPAYNPNELETCDDADSDLLLLLLDRDSDGELNSTPKAMLGNTQYLTTIPNCSGAPHHFCLRHDVDGLVWRVEQPPHFSTTPFSHTATFNAFGYVRASKTLAKYTCSPPDCSYVAVSDLRSRVYVFCQPVATTGRELKNRKTGRITSKIARQLLLSLPTHDEIMGLITLPSLVVVCTAQKIYAFVLNLDEA